MKIHAWWQDLGRDPVSWTIIAGLTAVAVAVFWARHALWAPRPSRPPRRPWRYRPRHRADADEHPGATIDSPPLRELMPPDGHLRAIEPVATVAEIEASLDEIEAAAGDQPIGWSDEMTYALRRFSTRLDRVKSALEDEHPMATYVALAVDEPTGSFSRDELKRLLDDEPWVFDVTQRFPVLEVTAS